MFLVKNKYKNIENNSLERGMTYLELVIVMSIFSILSAISIFNYQRFQSKVEIKNLSNDIALSIVKAQKDSISGKLSIEAPYVSNWKPSYGVYFNSLDTNDQFLYFADLDNTGACDDPGCIAPSYALGGEVLDIVNITGGNIIDSIYAEEGGCASPVLLEDLSIVFKRPNTSPVISSNTAIGCTFSYVSLSVSSSDGVSGTIKLYPSGRIQVD